MVGGFLFSAKEVEAVGENCFCYVGTTGYSKIVSSSESSCNTACGKQGNGVDNYQYNQGGLLRVGTAALSVYNCSCYKKLISFADSHAHTTSESSCNIACSKTSTYYRYGDDILPTNVGPRECRVSAGAAMGSVAKETVAPGLFYGDNQCMEACKTGGFKSYSYADDLRLHDCATATTGGTTQPDGAGPDPGGVTSNRIPGTTEAGGIVSCGRPGQNMCTLCDLIRGMNIIIKYLMKISVGVALLAVTIGGVMYVISAGDPTMTGQAKSTMKNAGIGFVVIFAGYLIINTTISYLGAKSTLGMKTTTTWGNFECNGPAR